MNILDYTSDLIKDRVKEYESISSMWDDVLSLYGNNIAVKQEDKEYTYKKLNEDIVNFRGYLYSKGYRPTDSINITSTSTYDFVKAFMAAQTLGLCVNVFPSSIVDNSLTIDEYSKNYSSDFVEQYYPESEDIAVVMFTGGTTGVPKKAALSNRCVMVALRNACYGYENVFEQKYLHVLPMHHVFGLIRSMLTCLSTGGCLLLCSNPRDLFDVAIKENPDICVLVPLLVERGVLLSQKLNKNVFGNSMKTIITGAAYVKESLATSCKQLNINLCPGYGLTETACLVSGNPDMLNHPSSVGLLYPDEQIRFINNEIQIKGKNIMSQYIGSKEKAFSEDGWLFTGDYGYLDEDGFLYILGRKKEMLLTDNGENVFPSLVEAKFKQLKEINDCELYVGEDNKLNLEVFPFEVDKYIDNKDMTNELLGKLQEINNSLEKHERAHHISLRFVDFNRTGSMKIIRRG